MFMGIQFLDKDGGGVAIVHEKWFTPRKTEVWWPPYKQQDHFNKSLKKGESPNENWTLYSVEKSFFEEGDYKKALQKIKKAEVTSDILTEDESLPKKRKILPPKRLFSSSSDDDDCEIRKELPPKIIGISPILKAKAEKNNTVQLQVSNKSKNVPRLSQDELDEIVSDSGTLQANQRQKSLSNPCSSQTSYRYEKDSSENEINTENSVQLQVSNKSKNVPRISQDEFDEIICNLDTLQASQRQKNFSNPRSSQTSYRFEKDSSEIEINKENSVQLQVSNKSKNVQRLSQDEFDEIICNLDTLQASQRQKSLSNPRSSQTFYRCEKNLSEIEINKDNISEFNKKVLTLLVQIKNQNVEIINLLQQGKSATGLHLDIPADIPVNLPLQNFRDVRILEEYLKDEKKVSAMASYYATLGGRDRTNKINTILKNLMSNDVAAEYSFLGSRNEKKSFQKLKLRKIVINVVLSTCKNATENEIDDAIKVWLKHAPKRFAAREKKNQNDEEPI